MNFNLTLVGQAISFAIFVWFCVKYVWPPILAAMEEREKKIADGLEAADRAQRDLELAKERASDEMKEAKSEAAGIIEQAHKQAKSLVEDAKEKAREEAERVKVAAQAEIEQEASRAKEELRGKVAVLAVNGAEKILQRSVDQAANQDILDQLAAEL